MDDRDDWQLLDEFVKGRSQGAFRELVERHLPVVYSVDGASVLASRLVSSLAPPN
jgi:hypothetical protein